MTTDSQRSADSPPALCERIDLGSDGGLGRLDALRTKLVSQGEMVSPAGRQRTIDVFGEPLTPRQVVERLPQIGIGIVKGIGLIIGKITGRAGR